ncbi:hypothetical protein B0H34DRAFT_794454 [Crassisporium funariophilum]|nr:hypothetical protein B0H34DRAFT_794454 [Crassisporium funariophilum]
MSRRESRASMGAARQNDALFEFENFKKKFLLANKHITKLNSTLSVRIEELNAQVSTLYVENLRLRASEIALAAQLKREREKSRKVMADAELASQNLTKHLNHLREAYNIQNVIETPPTPPSPRARRPVLNVTTSPTSPQFNRISRPPNVPGIYEDEEPCTPTSDENHKQATPPRRKAKSKPRLSASKLPLPTRGPSPTPNAGPPLSAQHVDLTAASSSSKRKPVRRQSGLLTVNTDNLSVPRSGSPAFGSPIRLAAGRAEEEEEYAAVNGGVFGVESVDQKVEIEIDVSPKKEKRKGKSKELRESESEKEAQGDTAARLREKKKLRDEDTYEGGKQKSKETPIPRTALQPIDSNVHEPTDAEMQALSNRQFLRPVSPTSSGPNSRGSSSPVPPGLSEGEGGAGGRERRTRKSVNYAEPKLNTKMRKPDPVPGIGEASARPKKRSSAAAMMTNTGYRPPSADLPDCGNEADADTEARSSLELPPPAVADGPLLLRGMNGHYINPELFPLPPSRPGSAAAMYSPGPITRTSGSTTSASSSNTNTTNTVGSSSSSGVIAAVAAAVTMKRKKSRPQLVISDEESDGAEADAEYLGKGSTGGGGGSMGSGSWVNVEGRRKALPKRSAATAAVAAIEDIRRHSLAY